MLLIGEMDEVPVILIYAPCGFTEPSALALKAVKAVILGAEYATTEIVVDAVAVLPRESVTVVAIVIVPL